MKNALSTIAAGVSLLAMAACSSHDYKVTATFPDDSLNGKMVYLITYDTGDTLASAAIDSGSVQLSGTVAQPVAANLRIGRGRKLIILEPGEINVDVSGNVSGTPLNTKLNDMMAQMSEIQVSGQSQLSDTNLTEAMRDSIYSTINDSMLSLMQQIYADNQSNPIGYLAFLDIIDGKSATQIDSMIATAPSSYTASKRIQKALTAAKNVEATAEGQHFVDFTIPTNDGGEIKFSDFVGNGRPVLVDFWASWCGPCRREIPNIKAIRDKYAGKLDVLGVAVWDQVADTKQAIESLEIPWPQIINAQTIPTDLYGIVGIPHIMIIDGDGTILSRGLQGEQLAAKVDEIMNR